ncbi:MAG TPA: hypothetical protein VJ436_12145 [Anaerolineales bacterium]|nr:hypothetical protein [Anaerolineales bacterium]
MPSGVPLDRQWIFVLKDGRVVFDWGDELIQDLLSGEFIQGAKVQFNHPIRDDELEILRRAGRVGRFDSRQVYVYFLPEPPRRTID